MTMTTRTAEGKHIDIENVAQKLIDNALGKGTRSPNLAVVKALAAKFGVTPAQLLKMASKTTIYKAHKKGLYPKRADSPSPSARPNQQAADELRTAIMSARECGLRHSTFVGLETVGDRFHWIRYDEIQAISCPRRIQENLVDEDEDEDEDDEADKIRRTRFIWTRSIFLRTGENDSKRILTILDTPDNLRALGFTFPEPEQEDPT